MSIALAEQAGVLGGSAQSAAQDKFKLNCIFLGATMNTPIRLAAASLLTAVVTCGPPAFAQNNAATAATTDSIYSAESPAPFGQTEKNRDPEQQSLGTKHAYGDGNGGPQRNFDDAQRAALLDEQRMTIPDGQTAAGKKGRPKAPAAANDPLRVAAEPGRPNTGAASRPAGAAKNAYPDPYGTGGRPLYRSPW